MLNNNKKQFGKKGQMMMVGLMILIMALLIFIATLPAISNIMDDVRGCSSLNCAGFVDQEASGDGCSTTNQSYLPTGNKNELSCTILDLTLPFIILGVLIALITKLLHGELVDKPEPQYGRYPGGY